MSEITLHPFEEFVSQLTRHQPDLWAYVISMMPGNPDAADVLQKANMVLWKKREKFEAGTSFIAWSFTVARFEVLNHLKKQRRSSHVLLDEELLDTIAYEAPSAIPRGDQRLAALELCIAKLRPLDRELLEHHYDSQQGLDKFGERVGRSVASLSVTLFRLRAALRKCVNVRLQLEGDLS